MLLSVPWSRYNNPMSYRVIEKMRSKSQMLPTGSVKHHFEDYCASTSIHGVKYLGEKGRPLGERYTSSTIPIRGTTVPYDYRRI